MLLSLLLSGCKKPKEEPVSDQKPTSESSEHQGKGSKQASPDVARGTSSKEKTSEEQPGAAPEMNESFLLKKAGDAPLRQMIYQYRVGNARTLHIKLDMNNEVTTPNGAMPATPMGFEMRGSVSTIEVLTDGAARELIELSELQGLKLPGAPQEAIDGIRAQYAALLPIQFEAVVDKNGHVRNMKTLDNGKNEQQVAQISGPFQEQIAHLLLPFPTEAIGKGAEWEHTTDMLSSGLRIQRVSHLTLNSIENDTIVINSVVTTSAEPNDLSALGLPPDTKLEKFEFVGSGSGTARIDLKKLTLISHVSAKVAQSTTMTAPSAPAPQTISNKSEIEAHVEVIPANR